MFFNLFCQGDWVSLTDRRKDTLSFNTICNENVWAFMYLQRSPHVQSFCLKVLLPWWIDTHTHHTLTTGIALLPPALVDNTETHTDGTDSVTSTADTRGKNAQTLAHLAQFSHSVLWTWKGLQLKSCPSHLRMYMIIGMQEMACNQPTLEWQNYIIFLYLSLFKYAWTLHHDQQERSIT